MPGQAPPSVTGFALMGLLSLRGEMSGYGLKQLADRTLRFFWVAPAMSHVYSELERLRKAGLVKQTVATRGRRQLRRYSLSDRGERVLKAWLGAGQVEFPGLKHEVALRLFLGHLTGPDRPLQLLEAYRSQLEGRIEELRVIRRRLGTDPHFQYPAMVAEWGIRYYQEELASVEQVGSQLVQPRF
ncbi:MAG TPA: helix-turn-helix transcriptional regulator [Candidatus Nanopelagicaceae bacterium]|nr:helix-turn-helix transcriptional regulator [Candidatus Nanopelagicaceae bacterium]